jgi:hypothetical protein
MKRFFLLAAVMVAIAAGGVWLVSSADNSRDWDVPGKTTDTGKRSLIQ